MNVNAELAGWGEPPPDRNEDDLVELLDKALDRLRQGRPIAPEEVRGQSPELAARGQEIVRMAAWLHECAASIWEHSAVVGQPTLEPGARAPAAPGPGHAAGGSLPDPFPGEF